VLWGGFLSDLAVQAQPTNAQGFLELGFADCRRGAYQDAVAPLKAALALEPGNYEGNLWLGYTYYSLGKYEAAAVALKAAARCRPGAAEARYYMGSAFYALKRYGEADAAYREAFSLGSKDADARFYLGCCQYYEGRYQLAAESFRQSTLAGPTNYDAQVWLGYSLSALGRPEQASEAFERAVRLRPNGYEANAWRGFSLIQLRRFDEAIPILERALDLRPGDAWARWLLLAGYLATGQVGRIPRLHLGLLLPLSMVLLASYLPALAWLCRKSLRMPAKPSPGLGFALAWCGIAPFGQILLSVVCWVLLQWPISRVVGVSLGGSAAPLVAASVLGFARQPWGEPFAWPPRNPGARLLAAILGAFIALSLLDAAYGWVVEHASGKPMPDDMLVSCLRAGTRGWPWAAFIGVALAGPAAEEILFRGLLFGALRKRLSAAWTIVVTGALFAAAHLEPIQFVPLFAAGLLLGWARQKSGGLALPIVVHCLNNSVALAIGMRHS
jgi:membrane protease YdiL (CAAX protease family)/Flp pilus assembly protein TadD